MPPAGVSEIDRRNVDAEKRGDQLHRDGAGRVDEGTRIVIGKCLNLKFELCKLCNANRAMTIFLSSPCPGELPCRERCSMLHTRLPRSRIPLSVHPVQLQPSPAPYYSLQFHGSNWHFAEPAAACRGGGHGDRPDRPNVRRIRGPDRSPGNRRGQGQGGRIP